MILLNLLSAVIGILAFLAILYWLPKYIPTLKEFYRKEANRSVSGYFHFLAGTAIIASLVLFIAGLAAGPIAMLPVFIVLLPIWLIITFITMKWEAIIEKFEDFYED